MELLVTGQPFPLGPLCVFRNPLRGLDCFPLSGRYHSNQIAFHDELRVRVNAFLSSTPADTSVEPSVFGCTMRACIMPGSRTAVAHFSVPATFKAIAEFGYDLPIALYWLTGLMGGFPVIIRPQSSEITLYGNGELELLVFHQIAVRDRFAPAAKPRRRCPSSLSLATPRRVAGCVEQAPGRYMRRPCGYWAFRRRENRMRRCRRACRSVSAANHRRDRFEGARPVRLPRSAGTL